MPERITHLQIHITNTHKTHAKHYQRHERRQGRANILEKQIHTYFD